ncbi:MAG TPA: HD domain-containing protein [Acidimicrobiales bacterium]|nr:HD domain-containing protein [Acidimicrobiales bacterium]
MTELGLDDHSTISAALQLARLWCDGQRIGPQDALTHALQVVDVLRRHVPDAAPEVIAAALLHDSPELAPPGLDLHAVLVTLLSPEVARLVEALQHEHDGLSAGTVPRPPADDSATMQASAADKIVSIATVLERARTDDPSAYWSTRSGFVAALPYFRAFTAAAEHVLPSTMTAELGDLVDRAVAAATPTRPAGPLS